MEPVLHLILVAAGSSRRFGGGDKLLADLNGAPVLVHALRRLTPAVTGKIVIAVPPGRIAEFEGAALPYTRDLQLIWCAGGSCRSESVRNAVAALGENASGIAAVHDAARPLADAVLLKKLYQAALPCAGSLPGKAVTDTLWRGQDELLSERVDREGLFAVETPQLFHLEQWRCADKKFPGMEFTDDASLLRHAGYDVALVINPEPNIKITTPADLTVLRQII